WPAGHIEFDTHTNTVAYQRGDRFPRTHQEALPDGTVRFWGDFARIRPKAGNVVVLRHGRRLHAGIFLNECEDISLEDVSLHACGGLGILAQFSKDLRFSGVSVTPNRQRGRRLVCGHDDGIHLSNNRGRITIEKCSFHGLMDDPVNLHGTAARIERIEDPFTLTGRFVHPQSRGFPHWAGEGDRISFVDAGTLASLGEAPAADYQLCTRETFRLSLKEPVPEKVRPGDALENLTNTAAFVCRNNHFGGCRARGLLVCTPKPVLVEGNLFESSGAAILIAGDASDWYECGSCGQVEIRNNVFTDACLTSSYEGGDAVITVHPHIAVPSRETPYHRNLRLADNLFYTSDAPVLYAGSAAGLEFRGNRILRSHRYPPQYSGKSMFSFDTCTGITLEENACVGEVLGKAIEISGMDPEDIRQDMHLPIICSDRKEL
ncbi:MAG: right-handed parallel beta-helix repeat-containing protein, partial [Faecousia sp.]